MDTVEPDYFVRFDDIFSDVCRVAVIVKRDATTDAERQIHLGGLIVFRHVRVEIVFPVPLGNFR